MNIGTTKMCSYRIIIFASALAACAASFEHNDNTGVTTVRRRQRRTSEGRTFVNHKPLLNCKNYRPEIKEEQPINTFVINVTAIDHDPPDNGGRITYSIVSLETPQSRHEFSINNETGMLVTNQVFDRDEPTRQKELHVTVKALDNGRPALADVCTFKVIILDINDNQPTFDKQTYDYHVSEDLKEKSEVMRVFAYDFDDGENARLTYNFSTVDSTNNFEEYFIINAMTGVIYLKKSLAQKKGTIFKSVVSVTDGGKPPKMNTADLTIRVVGSDKRPPMFITPTKEIRLPENVTAYDIVSLKAVSNIEDPGLEFKMINGKTTHTNKDQTFQLQVVPQGSEVNITLARGLDYETVTYYNLTVSAINKDNLVALASINIIVEDVNDEVPNFVDESSGSVYENLEPGTRVMQVQALDKDGTSPNNLVRYELNSHQDLFHIDTDSGVVTTLKTFDREENSNYFVSIKAYDGAPSSKHDNNEPNSKRHTFRILITDINDNKPQFEQSVYIVGGISENTGTQKAVTEVKAIDKDIDSIIQYSIVSGNVDDAFYMEEATGRIKVKNPLDFEKIESYNLTVLAFDGNFNDTATVIIDILNENDLLPVFEDCSDPCIKEIDIVEEQVPDDCIIRMRATDPDIKDKNADQKIIYRVEPLNYFSVTSEDGLACVRLIKPLDHDKPKGNPTYQGFLYAIDNEGIYKSLEHHAELKLKLEDINDNAPFLNVTVVVWNENQHPNTIIQLTADDYDSIPNGPPFAYSISRTASVEIKEKFSVRGDLLQANVVFDREEKKYYDVPIDITDSGTEPLTGESYIRVIIGDVNDNPAKSGSSEIFVYNYKDGWPNPVTIGKVYVDDPDDWDLPDKTFEWKMLDTYYFELDQRTGNITIKPGIQEGVYELKFSVTETPSFGQFETHTVEATVTVTIRSIPEEAVIKSGSMRLEGSTAEEFVEKSELSKLSKKDLLQQHMASVLNTSSENVDIFTVARSPENSSLIDVRFSAHGSPYYAPEKLNSKVNLSSHELEQLLKVRFHMINIVACVYESVCPGISCYNKLTIEDMPSYVYTNRTSFVGVNAYVEAVCECTPLPPIECYNGGTPDGTTCKCTEGFEGPHCEVLAIAFYGDGWALYPAFDSCNDSEITLDVSPSNENGLIFYVGPATIYPPPLTRDFMALQLENGYPVLLFDYGDGTTRIQLQYKKLTDGAKHNIKISFLTKGGIQLSIDDCHKSDCLKLGDPRGRNTLLHLSGPLQLGGTANDIRRVGQYWNWEYMPLNHGYHGCIKNLTYNGFTYNLGQPGEFKNAHPNCNQGVAEAVVFRLDSNFLVAILVCVAILLILLLAVVVHRRKQDNWNEKDTDDARENIIDYQVEGGGEFDADFNLDMLKQCSNDEKPPIREEPADIGVFLDSKKDTCDKDPDNLPYDDVRYYAYEGDGNSTGSLSSLASCTDEGDMKFNYLSSFGPRFRKLADMYGEEPSDEDSHDGGEESWC